MRRRNPLVSATFLAGTALLLGLPVRAEVRLIPRGQDRVEAKVSPSRAGIWAASPGQSDDRVLNPQGDLLGDGLPQLSETVDSVTAAWFRQATGEVLAAHGGIDGWSSPLVVGAGRPVGMPQILEFGDGQLLAWQERRIEDGAVRVRAVWLGDAELAAPTEVDEGRLLAAWAGPRSACLLVAEPLPGGGYEVVVQVSPDPPIIPIGLERVALESRPSDRRGAPLSAGLAQPSPHDQGPSAVYWWTSATGLSVLEIDPDSGEPLLPLGTFVDPKGRRQSPAWLKQVLHGLR